MEEAETITRETMTDQWHHCHQQANRIVGEIKKAVLGKDEMIIKVLLAVLARGHILIEDIPGVGKTTLAMAVTKTMSLEYHRLQFTPDVLPTDVTGFTIYNKNTGTFEYKPGAAICNLFLADEINRTSPKTQSALLEIMEEGKVTVDGVTRAAPSPFLVIATQNPVGSIGTQMLPESQMDRFMVRLSMGYPDLDSEINILKGKQNQRPLDLVNQVVTADEILTMQKCVDQVYLDDKMFEYIARLVAATREHPLIKLGVSPRGAIALTAVTRAVAFLRGRDYVIPSDVTYIFHDAVEHRIILHSKARISEMTVYEILEEIRQKVSAPHIG